MAPGLIHHSDHGGQYTAVLFGERCVEVGIEVSMGSIGDCYDNAVCESFHSTLKRELVHRYSWPTRAELRTAVFEYIEGFYNTTRRHSTLDNVSPTHYETQHHALTVTGPQLAALGRLHSGAGTVAGSWPLCVSTAGTHTHKK